MIAIKIKSGVAARCFGGVVCSVPLVLGLGCLFTLMTQMPILEISLPFTRIDIIVKTFGAELA